MNSRLYFTNLKLSKFSMSAWGLGIALWAALVCYLYNSFKATTAYIEIINSLPDGMKNLVGLDGVNLNSTEGILDAGVFLSFEYLSWMPLLLGIYSVFYCSGVISKEADRGTLDILLSQPIARHTLLITKNLSFVTVLIGLMLISWLTIYITFELINVEINLSRLAIVHLLSILVILPIIGYSTLASTIWLDPRKSLPVAGFITAVLWIMDLIGPLLNQLDFIQKASPFHYFDPAITMSQGFAGWIPFTIWFLVAMALLFVALIKFDKRDLT